MPIIAWNCPVCHTNKVPLNHFEVTACGLSLHPDYAQAVLHSNDDYYGRNLLTVTDGLGCPRSRALEYDADVAVNPFDYNPLLIGRAWDAVMEQHAADGTAKVRVAGEIAGLHLEGELDRVRRFGDELIIEDHKHANQFQLKWIKKDVEEGKPVKMEYRIQIRMYAELYFQQFGELPTKGILWNHFSGPHSNSSPVLYPIAFSVADLSVEECLAHKPYGGTRTVLELYQSAARYRAGELTPIELPLVGMEMSFGTKQMCDYCQVKDVCYTLERGAAF